MIMSVFVEPHERQEAIDAYRDRLSDAQITEMEDAPETALIQLEIFDGKVRKLIVIEEG